MAPILVIYYALISLAIAAWLSTIVGGIWAVFRANKQNHRALGLWGILGVLIQPVFLFVFDKVVLLMFPQLAYNNDNGTGIGGLFVFFILQVYLASTVILALVWLFVAWRMVIAFRTTPPRA
jgi:hypothetical protein